VFLRLLFLLLLLSLPRTVIAQQSGTKKPESGPGTCPVTRPYQTSLFIPPAPYAAKPGNGRFWFGTDRLWTSLPVTGMLKGLPEDTTSSHPTFSEKLFWWRQGYDAHAEPRPKLIVTGKLLDSPAPRLEVYPVTPLEVSPATNAFAAPRSAMLVGVGFPTVGCWQITGRYEDDELTFVIWVAR
jgi:hypothetical protein